MPAGYRNELLESESAASSGTDSAAKSKTIIDHWHHHGGLQPDGQKAGEPYLWNFLW
jgi:hypothetical protein